MVLTVAFLFPVLRNGFTNWDDPLNISGNPFLVSPTWSGLWHLWTHYYSRLYIPLVYSSYFVEIDLSGLNPTLMHVTNLVLHAGSAVMVLRVIILLLQMPPTTNAPASAARGDWAVVPAAVIGALVFALHPLQTEPVAWLTGRKDVLSGVFAIGALWQHLEWRLSSGPPERRKWHYIAATASFVFSLLAKPSAVTLPLVLLALDWYAVGLPVRKSLAAIWPYFVVSGLWTTLTIGAQPIEPELRSLPIWTRPAVAADALMFYCRKLLLPVNLSPDYERVPWKVMGDPTVWVSGLVVAVALAAIFRRKSRLALAAALFLIFLLPVLGLVPFNYQTRSTVADRYVYLSMLGVAYGVASGILLLMTRIPTATRVVSAMATLLVLALGVQSCRQATVWRDSYTLWQHACAISPESAVLQHELGMAYYAADDKKTAIEVLHRALAINPSLADANANLGSWLVDDGRYEEAAQYLHRALRTKPDHAGAHNSLGTALLHQGKPDDAAKEFAKAIESEPDISSLHLNLGYAYLSAGETQKAEEEMRRAVALAPMEVRPHMGLGLALEKSANPDQAIAQYMEVLRLSPGNPQANSRLAKLSGR